MTPYRTCAETEDDFTSEGMSCTEAPFRTAGCPTCGACVARTLAGARHGARRSGWTMVLGAFAAIALAMTTFASWKILLVSAHALHRLDRQEARREARELDAMVKAVRDASKQSSPAPERSHPAHRHHLEAPRLVMPAITPPAPPVVVAAYGLDALGPETHDPIELRRRAQRLGQLGLAVPVFHASVSGSALATLLANDPHALVLSPEKLGDATVGVRLSGVTPALAATGLQNGDVLTTMNGLRLRNAADVALAFAVSRQVTPHAAVVELMRAGHPAILDVSLTD